VSFIGFGMGAAVLPLLFTERGSQMSYIVRAILLLVSGVYYPISVLPLWMQPLARLSPATYVLDGLRAALLHGESVWSTTIWNATWPLIITGVVSVPLGVAIFRLPSAMPNVRESSSVTVKLERNRTNHRRDDL